MRVNISTHSDYFLIYERKENGNFGILGSKEEILGKAQKGFWQRLLGGIRILIGK